MTVSQPGAVSVPRVSSGPKFEAYRPRIGALVSGIDLGEPIDEATRLRLQKALLQYGVLFFRDQSFGPQRFLEAARVFGEPYKQNRYSHELDGYPDIEVLENSDRRQQKADVWHADVTWQPNPPKATILQAIDLPADGGDTVWASTAAAYELLDPKLAAYLETLTAVNTFEVSRLQEYLLGTYGGKFPAEGGEQRLADARAAHPPIEVPVIATHPETGRKVINVNEGHTSHIKGVTRVAGQSLLTLLFDAIKTPEIQARFKWKPGSVAVWDNRQLNHYGVNDYGQGLRRFHRLTIRAAAPS
jgi:alpha-ketoglutarate-dependent taurine dioxygenase